AGTSRRRAGVRLRMSRRAPPGGRPLMGFSLAPRIEIYVPACRPGTPPGSADQAIRLIQHLRRDRIAESRRNLQVDDEFEPRIDFDRDRGGRGALANLLDEPGRLPAGGVGISPIADEPPVLDQKPPMHPKHPRAPV